MHILHLNQRNQILFQYLRDKKKKKKGAQKKGVKIHPFHLPWIRACFTSFLNKQKGVSEHTEKVWEKKGKCGYYDHEKRRNDSLAQISYIQPKPIAKERENKPNFTCFL